MGLGIVQVDAFASRPFSGNPAGVCVLPAPRDERWMQDVAAELNPAAPPAPAVAPPGLAAALRVGTRWIGRSKFDYLVEVDSEDVVRGLKPDLAAVERVDARGIIVTSQATTPGFDFVSRFFAPQSGVPEDPVTGSAHCALAPYWCERLPRTALTRYPA